MNIFVLDENPRVAAKYMCDKHVVKMVTESAQMLSTVHRILDGSAELRPSKSGKKKLMYWKLPDERENVLYRVAHQNHPCTIWAAGGIENYQWLVNHYQALAEEYTKRYGKMHKAFWKNNIGLHLSQPPFNIQNVYRTPFAIAMKKFPQCIVHGDAVKSYRNYYIMEKSRFAKWKIGGPPEWFTHK